MDYTQVISWVVSILTRGLAWVFAAYLGMEATKAQGFAAQAGTALGALALVGVSVYTSIKSRQKLLNTPPPATTPATPTK
jgi:hypothetical protein